MTTLQTDRVSGTQQRSASQPILATVIPAIKRGQSSVRSGDFATAGLVKDALMSRVTTREQHALTLIERYRPISLRDYDQIPMRPLDLLQQVRLMAPYLDGRVVAFVGDHDCTSMLIGLLGSQGYLPMPARMMLLDFDERLLCRAQVVAQQYGFGHIMDYCLYNVFEAVPQDLAGKFDWFYTNPPYGRYNKGESARLFITRGIELTQRGNACGCIILPDDSARPWTRKSMLATQRFLSQHGWTVDVKLNQLHQYRLDDDQELASSVILVKTDYPAKSGKRLPYACRHLGLDEIEHFYGRSIKPPYPRYIRQDNSPDYNWERH
ncbi:MAG: bis-aminopropyl spermidine synthase family protein [Anaerolineae bacterium]|nr:bis-aminopropyl spermidine synthase family protein [Anaerolineae bacterium]